MPADLPSDLRARTGRLIGATRRRAARLTGAPGRRGWVGVPVAPAPDRLALDSWLSTFWGDALDELDGRCAASEAVPWDAFGALEADVWAALLTRDYSLYPHIRAALPDVPDPALQATWNGASGAALAGQSVIFYERLRTLHARHGGRPLAASRVLDFGCGWGRLTRLFARDVPVGNLFGCDPVSAILDVCRSCRVPAELARSEFVPERLPFPGSFDLIYAFSVFTHLSERAHRACLRALHDALAPGGLLVVTVRPPEYLRLSELLGPALRSLGPDPATKLGEARYLFAPHDAQPLGAEPADGEVTYGETVVTAGYIRRHWTEWFDVVGFELLLGDPYQVVVALRRR
ncbi:MAG TPA: class I SAM-dependent methyltransferase [Solirubrobacteraceae bacterium]|jgi:SAM-dependent methyltransferase|nr:class I SAM-dependent methyltransferase [Solirubrobacteraceae bacterium]